jgi:hypothetical protein
VPDTARPLEPLETARRRLAPRTLERRLERAPGLVLRRLALRRALGRRLGRRLGRYRRLANATPLREDALSGSGVR